jgi:hypothetical protein
MFSKLFYHSTHAKDIVANKYYTFFRLSFFKQTICFFFYVCVYTSCDPYATFFIKSHNIFLLFNYPYTNLNPIYSHRDKIGIHRLRCWEDIARSFPLDAVRNFSLWQSSLYTH